MKQSDKKYTEFGGADKAWSKAKRAHNREASAQILLTNGIHFTEHNNGAHLRVQASRGVIDFWPGTGKWIAPWGESGRGIRQLLVVAGGDVSTAHEYDDYSFPITERTDAIIADVVAEYSDDPLCPDDIGAK